MNIKAEIAPKDLEFKASEFVISDKYATILTVIAYPKVIQTGFLSSISSLPGVKIVIKHIPVPFSSLSKMLNKQIADLKQKYIEEKDQTLKERFRQDLESLEYFTSQIASSQSKIFDFQMHLMIVADTKEELDLRKINTKNYLEAADMKALSLRFDQEKVFKSMLPIFPKQEVEKRVGTPIASPTISAMYPFIFDSVKDEGLATLLGVDFSGGVILFNQFLYQIKKENNRNNANLIILGTSGSGKSTTAKLVLRGHIRNDYQIVAIDPEGEISEMTKLYGGNFVDLGKGGEFGMVNPLEIILDADEDELKEGF